MTHAEQNAVWYQKNAERIKTELQKKYATNLEFRQQAKDKAAKQYAADPEAQKIRSRKSTLGRYFKMTPEKYAEMFEAQGGRCLICGRTANEVDPHRQILCVDHDHACCPGVKSCGKCIRGLICSHCNNLLGHARDSIEVLESAIAYLKSYKHVNEVAV
jgi:hypothetical protein